MATLRDVADLAGVSAMTVSNVVNGREGKVSAATVERVRQAITALGYVPNAQARALAGASSRIVALVYGVGEDRAPLAVSHESVFVGACEEACRERGLALMLCAAGPEPAAEVVRRLRSWNVEGVVAVGTVPVAVYQALAGLEVPVVAIDSRSLRQAGPDLATLTVGIDDVAGGRLAGEHLARLGHRDIVFAAPYPATPGVDRDRLEGLREGLGEAGRVRVVEAKVDFDAGVELGLVLASADGGDATAVFASGDVLAMGLVAGLRRAGRQVPEQVSVVGFDGFAVSTYCDPVLTTVVQPVHAKAAEAVRLVAEGAQGGAGGDVVLPVSWREGGTLAPAA